MTKETAIYRRVLRRETHASRTIPAVVVASVTLVVLLSLLVGAVGWLMDPLFREAVATLFAGVTDFMRPQAAVIGAGVLLLVLALTLLALAVLPGRRARRARTTDRSALVVDDGVIADSVAEATARRAGVDRGQVSVTVGRRMTTVKITPTSGIPVDKAAAESAVDETLSGIGFVSRPSIVIAAEGVIA